MISDSEVITISELKKLFSSSMGNGLIQITIRITKLQNSFIDHLVEIGLFSNKAEAFRSSVNELMRLYPNDK